MQKMTVESSLQVSLVKRFAVIACLGLVAVGSLSACGPQAAPPPPPVHENPHPTPADVEHRVAYPRETLAAIANWYTGKASNWTILRDANPGIRPERMNLGQKVIIPGALVVRTEPMPRRFIQDSGNSKPRRSTAGSSAGQVGVGNTDSLPQPVNDTGSGITDTAPLVPPSNDSSAGSKKPEVNVEDLLQEHKNSGAANADSKPAEAPIDKGPADKAPEKAPTPAAGDKEREQLLDELLTQ